MAAKFEEKFEVKHDPGTKRRSPKLKESKKCGTINRSVKIGWPLFFWQPSCIQQNREYKTKTKSRMSQRKQNAQTSAQRK